MNAVRLCTECAHAVKPDMPYQYPRCDHPMVNKRNQMWLASAQPADLISCQNARDPGWFEPCGIKGKLWEPKP